MSPADAAAALAHDVGKYVARIAKNVPEGEAMPESLRPLLARDLYEAPSAPGHAPRRPSEVFETLAPPLERAHSATLDVVRMHLSAIDALERAVRMGNEGACTAACVHALAVERTLRELAARLRDAP